MKVKRAEENLVRKRLIVGSDCCFVGVAENHDSVIDAQWDKKPKNFSWRAVISSSARELRNVMVWTLLQKPKNIIAPRFQDRAASRPHKLRYPRILSFFLTAVSRSLGSQKKHYGTASTNAISRITPPVPPIADPPPPHHPTLILYHIFLISCLSIQAEERADFALDSRAPLCVDWKAKKKIIFCSPSTNGNTHTTQSISSVPDFLPLLSPSFVPHHLF